MTTAPVTVLRAKPEQRSRRAPTRPATPLWLDDDAIVHRALGVKRTHPPSPHFWPRLAVLAQIGAAIVIGHADDIVSLACASRLLRDLAAQLPTPAHAPYDPRRPGPLSDALRHRPHPTADLADAIAALAVVLADPHPPRLDYVAILLDELAITLWVYRYTTFEPLTIETTTPGIDGELSATRQIRAESHADLPCGTRRRFGINAPTGVASACPTHRHSRGD